MPQSMAEKESTRSFTAAKDLVGSPRETLAHELKEWLDPRDDHDLADLVRAILAMRNHEFGGVIAIGISDDGTHQKEAPQFDLDSAYTQEAIQAIVSKYASRSFEVEVHRIELNGLRYPVIVVPGATDMPVVCRSAIGQGQRPHLRESAIYVRTLDQNRIPSSAQASWKHIEKTFEICFRNREANYAEFFSRILRTAEPSEVRSLVVKAKEISEHALEAFEGLADFHRYSLERFWEAVTEEQFDVEKIDFLDMVLVIDGVSERKWQNDNRFLTTLITTYPNLFGARIWKISQSTESRHQPYTFDGTYEQRLFIPPSDQRIIGQGFADFMIFDPVGRFFLVNGYNDDLLREAPLHSGQVLDPVTQIWRLAESFVVGAAYAKALGYQLNTQLHFAIGWNGLKGRKLVNWTTRQYDFHWAKECHAANVQLEITLPIEPSSQEIIQKTTEAIQKLGRAFDVTISEQIVANEVKKYLNL
jgi:hypothetical protein